MKHLMRRVLPTVMLLLVCGTSAAHGATIIVTPFVDAHPSQVAECWATNFGTAPAAVSIGLFNASGVGIGSLIADTCSAAPIGSGKSCLVATYGGVLCRAVVASTPPRDRQGIPAEGAAAKAAHGKIIAHSVLGSLHRDYCRAA